MTVTKRRITTAERQLHAIGTLAAALEHRWPAITAAADALAPDVLHGTATDRGRSAGGVSDPTSNVALSRDHWQDVLDAIGAWQAQGAWISEQVRRYEAETPQAVLDARDRARARCSGRWDPLCTNWAAPDRGGECDRCYMAAYRAKKNGDVTLHVAQNCATVARQPVVGGTAEVVATCNCGEKFPGATRDEVEARLAQHKASSCALLQSAE